MQTATAIQRMVAPAIFPQLWSWLQDFLHEGLDPGGVDGARGLTWHGRLLIRHDGAGGIIWLNKWQVLWGQ